MFLKFFSISNVENKCITNIKRRDVADKLFDERSLGLEDAIAWFYEHKNDDEFKDALKTVDELEEEEQGKYKFIPSKSI